MNPTRDQLRATIFNYPCTQTTAKRRRKQLEKPVHGVGVLDAWFVTQPTVNGKRVEFPAYIDWMNMIERCYSDKFHETNPTYKGCSVCEEWLSFMNFFHWWVQQPNTTGMQLDKDLLYPGNKIYSPDRCVFVPGPINLLISVNKQKDDGYPLGVGFHKKSGKLQARCSDGRGKKVWLGLFDKDDEETAHRTYLTFKAAVIQKYIFAGDLNPPILWGLQQHLSIAHGELLAYETQGPLIQSKALRVALRAL